jgi:fatty-acyl-CoA synthase
MDTHIAQHPFEAGLDRHPANFVALSPVWFLKRSVATFAEKLAVIDGDRRFTYAQVYERWVRLASALAGRGIGRLDTVAILASNIPEMIEAHYAIPMLGRGARSVEHPAGRSGDRLLAQPRRRQGADRGRGVRRPRHRGAEGRGPRHPVIGIANPGLPDTPAPGSVEYEAFLAGADPRDAWQPPADEWQSICLFYTSPAPPGTRRGPCTATGAHTSRHSATR